MWNQAQDWPGTKWWGGNDTDCPDMILLISADFPHPHLRDEVVKMKGTWRQANIIVIQEDIRGKWY